MISKRKLPMYILAMADPLKASLAGQACCRHRSGGHRDAEVSQPLSVIPDQMLAVQLVEVVATEVSAGPAVVEKVPRRDEDRMADGHNGFLVAPAAGDPVILRGQVAASRTAPRAHSTSVARNQRLPLRVFPDLRFPALSLLPGQMPVQEAACAAVKICKIATRWASSPGPPRGSLAFWSGRPLKAPGWPARRSAAHRMARPGHGSLCHERRGRRVHRSLNGRRERRSRPV